MRERTNARRLWTAHALALALAATACGPSGGGPGDAGGDGAGDDASGAGQTYTFVVSDMAIDPGDDPTLGPAAGFNLDGLYSSASDADGCVHQDFVSALDPDQNMPDGCTMLGTGCRGGVDNQLPSLANALDHIVPIRDILRDEVTHNHLVVLARITGVDSLADDPNVSVNLYIGYPTFTTDCDRVLPDREYSVDATTVDGGDIERAHLSFAGAIVRGRLRLTPSMSDPTIPIPLPVFGGAPLTLTLHGVQFRMDLTAQAGERGNLGGYLDGDEVLRGTCATFPSYCMVDMPIVGNAVDIRRMGVCFDASAMTPQFGSIGVGINVRAVSARISSATPVATGPARDTCGALTPIGDGAVPQG